MEITVKHELELGAKTMAFILGMVNTSNGIETPVAKLPAVKTPAPVKKAVAPAAVEVEEETVETEDTDEGNPADEAPTPAKPAPAKPAPAKAAAPTPAKPVAPAKPAAAAKPTAGQILATPYEDLTDDAAKLAHLMAHVTKHTKNGKGSDVKALLAEYSVDRASELDPEWYESFNEAITRYSAGESVADIFPTAD